MKEGENKGNSVNGVILSNINDQRHSLGFLCLRIPQSPPPPFFLTRSQQSLLTLSVYSVSRIHMRHPVAAMCSQIPISQKAIPPKKTCPDFYGGAADIHGLEQRCRCGRERACRNASPSAGPSEGVLPHAGLQVPNMRSCQASQRVGFSSVCCLAQARNRDFILQRC